MRGGNESTDQIERDLEHTRAHLDATIDALQTKLSPGQMVDQAVAYVREGGGADFARNLGRKVRDNPLPVTLAAVGLGWLMVAGDGRRERASSRRWTGRDTYGGDVGTTRMGAMGDYETSRRQMYEEQQRMPYEAAAYEDLATKAHDAGAQVQRYDSETDEAYDERVYTAKGSVVGVTRGVGETLHTFRERVEQAISAAAEKVRHMASSASSGASHAAGRGRSTMGDAYGYARGRARDSYDYGRSTASSAYGYGRSAMSGLSSSAAGAGRRARDLGARSFDYIEDHPLVMGALGLTVGAVLGMLVPPSRYEQEKLRGVREALSERAREALHEAGDSASRVVGAMVDAGRESASREHLGENIDPREMAHRARESVRSTAHGARTVVEESVSAGREALQREMEGSTSGSTAPNRNGPSANEQQRTLG